MFTGYQSVSMKWHPPKAQSMNTIFTVIKKDYIMYLWSTIFWLIRIIYFWQLIHQSISLFIVLWANSFEDNYAKCGKPICSNLKQSTDLEHKTFFKLLQTCQIFAELVQTCAILSKLFQTWPYLSKLVQTCPNLSKLAQTCPNLPELAWACLNFLKTSESSLFSMLI